MKNRIKECWCRVVGHRWNYGGLTYYAIADCERCGYQQPCGPTEPWTLANWIWWKRQSLWWFWYNAKSRLLSWWRSPNDDVPF